MCVYMYMYNYVLHVYIYIYYMYTHTHAYIQYTIISHTHILCIITCTYMCICNSSYIHHVIYNYNHKQPTIISYTITVREFTKGGFVKGGLSIRHACNLQIKHGTSCITIAQGRRINC